VGEKGSAHSDFVGKPEGRRTLRQPRRLVDNIKMDLKEMGCQGVTQNRDQ
jgi:hypothetical protein